MGFALHLKCSSGKGAAGPERTAIKGQRNFLGRRDEQLRWEPYNHGGAHGSKVKGERTGALRGQVGPDR